MTAAVSRRHPSDAPGAPAARRTSRRRVSRRYLFTVLGTILATLAVGAFAITQGEYPLALDQIVGAFLGEGGDGIRRIVLDGRLPRILFAVLAGAGLAISGAIFQSITRNPLGSPDIIGFTTGAYTGALLVLLFAGQVGTFGTALGALLGGLLTAVLVYALSWRRGVHGYRLVVVGIGVSFFLQALNGWMIIRTDLESAMAAASWSVGSFSLVTWGEFAIASSVVLVVLPLVFWVVPRLRILELGDDAAAGLGVKPEQTRMLAVLAAIVLVAIVTAFIGPIAFIALAAPQIASRIAGTSGIAILPAAAMGGFLTLVSDVIAQRIIAPSNLPVGIVTVIIGGAYLIVLLIVQARKS